MPSLKEQIKKIEQELSSSGTNVEIKLFESSDDLVIPETSNLEGKSGGGGAVITKSGKFKASTVGEDGEGGQEGGEGQDDVEGEPTLSDEGEGEGEGQGQGQGQGKGKGKGKGKGQGQGQGEGEGEGEGEGQGEGQGQGQGKGKGKGKGQGDEGDEGDEGEGQGQGQGQGKEKSKLKVGQKVRIKSKGTEGVITKVNGDGTYEVTEVNEGFAEGGSIKEKVNELEKKLKEKDGTVFIKIFESTNVLEIPQTTQLEGRVGTGTGVSIINGTEGTSGMGKEPVIITGGDTDGTSGDGTKDPQSPCKIRVGQKVRIKSSGKLGVVTSVSEDCTYTVQEIGTEELLIENGYFSQLIPIQDEGDYIPMDEDTPMQGHEDTAEETYPEGDLEPINENEGGDDGGDDDGQQQPPPEIDIEELKEKLMRIRRHKFKLPAFAKAFFNADLDDFRFYYCQAKLVLLHRLSKDVLKYKNPMSVPEGTEFLSFENDYSMHLIFLNRNVHLASGYFYIRPEQKLSIIIERETRELPSLIEIEDVLETATQEDYQVLMSLTQMFLNIEQSIVNDDKFYRILSLSAFYKPELFSDNWLKPHLDYMFSFYYSKNLGFSNLLNPCFTGKELDNEYILANMRRSVNLNVFNVLRQKDDYIIYACFNIRTAPDKSDRCEIKRLNLTELYTNNDNERNIRIEILYQLAYFYKYSLQLQNNNQNKQLSLINLEKLSILQQQSYSAFVTDMELLLA